MKNSLKKLSTETLKTRLSTLQGTAKIDCLNELANRSMLYSKYQEGLSYARQAHNLAVQLGANKQIADSLMQFAAFQLHQMNFPETEKNYYQAFALYKEANDLSGEANSQYKLGVYFWIQSENGKSTEHFLAALNLYQQLADKREISTCHTYLGRNFVELGEFETALDYYFEALDISRTSKNSGGTIKLLTEIGDVFFELERFDESIWYYEEALLIIEKNPNKNLENELLHRLGKTYYADKKYDEAAVWFERNLIVAREINDRVSEERITNYLFRNQQKHNQINEDVRVNNVQNIKFVNSNAWTYHTALFAKAC